MSQPEELSLLCTHLSQLFSNKITGTGNNPLAVERNFLSKALAAYYLYREAGAMLDDAVAATIDGGGDNGIDSIYIAADHTIWLIQSKYIHTGVGEPDLGDVSKFAGGVKDLIAGHYDRFLTLNSSRKHNLQYIVNQGEQRFKAVLVHTGGGINDDRRRIFKDLENEFNTHKDDHLQFISCGLSILHELHCQEFASQPIDCSNFKLYDFGVLNNPHKAYYGKMKVKDLCELGRLHKDNLIEKNIRRYKGTTRVNKEIRKTLQSEAERFFYFNNGITFLCKNILSIGSMDPSRKTCNLRVKDLSVINGAQTIGTIASFDRSVFEEASPEVLVTLICLGNAEDDFSERVTQYRNLQNAIDLKDFSSLDQRQYAWQKTLNLAGYLYIVKTGKGDPKPSERVMHLKDTAIYLACAYSGQKWADYVKAAKMDQDRLFRRPTKQCGHPHPLDGAYEELFQDSLTAHQLWRISQIGRIVEATTRARAISEVDSAE